MTSIKFRSTAEGPRGAPEMMRGTTSGAIRPRCHDAAFAFSLATAAVLAIVAVAETPATMDGVDEEVGDDIEEGARENAFERVRRGEGGGLSLAPVAGSSSCP
ncbi:hypothetical protein GH5_06357 [Leishmania sp. Ghana 2012 LV757]|uniref:hypothetical protein n=1 Tax=Leishmania sp. Ghana 2012 LV757 TaxID=2803181 RepID=UPI001B65CBC7|nr:hypothetical protein GH5_06357 [Leishmania sp. Ghana 2012 LV757]